MIPDSDGKVPELCHLQSDSTSITPEGFTTALCARKGRGHFTRESQLRSQHAHTWTWRSHLPVRQCRSLRAQMPRRTTPVSRLSGLHSEHGICEGPGFSIVPSSTLPQGIYFLRGGSVADILEPWSWAFMDRAGGVICGVQG